jgi:hypothetical protein
MKLLQDLGFCYSVLQVVRNGFTADGIFGCISIYLEYRVAKAQILQKLHKTFTTVRKSSVLQIYTFLITYILSL